MFESEIEQLKKHIAAQLPQTQPFVYLHDILACEGIADCYKHSIQAEVDWWIYEEQQERTDHPHFDTTAPELQEIFAALDDSYRRYARFNTSQLVAAIDSAAKIRLNFLCRPRTTLKWFVFRGAPTKTVYEILLRLAYFDDYDYLIKGFHQWAEKTYSEHPAMDLLSVVEFEKIMETIDNDYILDLSPHQFVDMLIPLFEFFHLGKEFTPQLTIPTEALIVFLDDKGVELIAHEIERLLYNEDMEYISQERFLDIVTEIINQIEEQESHIPPSTDAENSNRETEEELIVEVLEVKEESIVEAAEIQEENELPKVEEELVDEVPEVEEEIIDEVPEVEEEIIDEVPEVEEEIIEEVPEVEEESIEEVPEVEEESIVEVSEVEEVIIDEEPEIEEAIIDEEPEIEEAIIDELPKIEEETIVELPEIEEESIVEVSEVEEVITIELPEVEEDAIVIELPEIEEEAIMENSQDVHIAEELSPLETTLPEIPKPNIPSLVNYIDNKQRDEYIKKLCAKDGQVFTNLIEEIDNCAAWREAAQVIDKFFLRHKLDHRSATAISFRTVVQKRYSGV